MVGGNMFCDLSNAAPVGGGPTEGFVIGDGALEELEVGL